MSEAYLPSHLLEGFVPDTAKTELEQTRTGVESGKLDEPWNPAQQLEVVINSPDEGAGTSTSSKDASMRSSLSISGEWYVYPQAFLSAVHAYSPYNQ